jgi:hypothetical protein
MDTSDLWFPAAQDAFWTGNMFLRGGKRYVSSKKKFIESEFVLETIIQNHEQHSVTLEMEKYSKISVFHPLHL